MKSTSFQTFTEKQAQKLIKIDRTPKIPKIKLDPLSDQIEVSTPVADDIKPLYDIPLCDASKNHTELQQLGPNFQQNDAIRLIIGIVKYREQE